jgi:putative ABC transport system ATP-binding protein
MNMSKNRSKRRAARASQARPLNGGATPPSADDDTAKPAAITPVVADRPQSPPADKPTTATVSADKLAVHCRGVTKIYSTGTSQVTALRGIDLDVATGELMMLVGPSGCGKTTLISVVAGRQDPLPRPDDRVRVSAVQSIAESHRGGKRRRSAADQRHAASRRHRAGQ